MMARTAEYRDDIAGAIATGGTSTAYTVTSYQVFDTLAHMANQMIAFTPHTTNGATVTLNVDGLGAKPLRPSPSIELQAGVLVQGTPYVATYNNSDAVWYLRGFFGNPYNIPLGGGLPFIGTTAPNSSFVFPYGQAISRTTYSALFALTSTVYGVGDGSTTFNLPDLRGRVPAGKDDMGGSAANRITNAGSGIVGTTLGASSTTETVTLVTSNLPPYTPTVQSFSLTVPLAQTNTSGTKNGGEIDNNTPTASAIVSGSITMNPQGGTSVPFSKVQPTIILNYIIRII